MHVAQLVCIMQTMRLMTVEELAEQARLHNEAAEGHKIDESVTNEGATDEGGVEAACVDSGEDLSNVEADLSELMAGKEEHPPTLWFGRSLAS